MILFPSLPPESRRILTGFSGLVDKVLPVPKQFRSALAGDVAELSRLLTSGRGDRGAAYPGQAGFLSAYLRYFLPWNLYRLCRLLPALSLPLSDGDAVIDLGSGPLTLPTALWICRPELRGRALEFRCVDRSAAVMEAGKQIFTALSGASCPWTIKTIGAFIRPAGDRAPSGGPGIYGPPARLVTAVNFFNELYDGIPHRDSAVFRRFADKQAHFLSFLAAENGSLLVIEPGVPRSGEFISALRDSLLQRGRRPAAPCPHAGTCPCPGGRAAHKTRWCHFAFDTDGAAPALVKLSAAAGIPKERATLSFIYTGPAGDGNTVNPGSGRGAVLVRIISDPFPVNTGGPGGKPGAVFGRYGCSERGLILVRGGRELVEDYEPGMLAELVFQGTERRDTKSGALVLVPPGTVRIQNLKR